MADWTKSMQQSFEYYVVDPITWKDKHKFDKVKKCVIQRDTELETLGSASIDVTELVGECYLRAYLVTVQNGVTERHPLGTYLVQTPSSSFTGRVTNATLDAYTPLIELKECPPPIGYFVPEGKNIMEVVCALTKEHLRAPVVIAEKEDILYYDFVVESGETWLKYLSALMANAKYTFALDELGRILFAPKQETASLQPVWTFDDSDNSILYPEINTDHDLFDIPNVVEVIHSKGSTKHYARVVNDDPNSPTSTISRGREIVHRAENPSLVGSDPTKHEIDEYAISLLKELSTIEYTVTYSHGYCPVRIGDCVRLNYTKAGLIDVKAKVISQTITCTPGVQVQEKAIFTKNLWG